MTEPLYVVGLEVRNILGVKTIALDFDPKGELVVIGGNNANGKSSLIRGLEMAIEGAAAMPAETLRRGAASGFSKVTLAGPDGAPRFHVERRVTPRGTTLVVTDAEGDKLGSPQGLLDGFISAIGFDPLEFARLAGDDPKKAADVLRGLVGIDFADLDAARDNAANERLLARRDVASLEAQLAAKPPLHRDVPAEPVSVADLTAELSAAQAEIDRVRELGEGARLANEAADRVRGEIDEAEDALAAARAEVERLEALVETRREDLSDLLSRAAEATERHRAGLAGLPDTGAISARIAESDDVNRKVRENAERRALEARLRAARDEFDAAQRAIEDAAEQRRKRIAEASFPVDGLGFDEAGTVTLNDLPFAQASDAERVRTSLAVGMALNPRLRAITCRRGGNDLDGRALALVREMARERGFLVVCERVGDGAEVQVVIEDGEVAEDRRAVEASA